MGWVFLVGVASRITHKEVLSDLLVKFMVMSVLAPSSDALAPSSFLLLVVRPGATSSVLAPSSDAPLSSRLVSISNAFQLTVATKACQKWRRPDEAIKTHVSERSGSG